MLRSQIDKRVRDTWKEGGNPMGRPSGDPILKTGIAMGTRGG